jgi:hypothetical protein
LSDEALRAGPRHFTLEEPTMSRTCRWGLLPIVVCFLVLSIPAVAGDDWLPAPKEDLAMKDYAAFPGQHAVILYRKVERNDKDGWEKNYIRIKILDEEGKKYANIQTESFANWFRLDDLQARTIKPDGTIVPFTGKVFDKLVAKYKDYSEYAKSFTIPDVQVGSIIEYRYTFHWENQYRIDSTWNVQSDLATRDADFALKMYEVPPGYVSDPYTLSWVVFFLPNGTAPKKEKDGWFRMTSHNVPPLEKEDYVPPMNEMQARVEFNYTEGALPKSRDEYWDQQAKRWTKGTEEYLDKSKAAQKEIAAVVSPGDSPEVKLKKLYDHIQKMRNLTYERAKLEKELKNEKLKENRNIEDILKHGYGTQTELNNAFVELARVAGFPATLIRITERNRYFPHKEVWKVSRFDTEIAVVTLNGKQLYFDPGTPMCPFGLLAWEDTGVTGLLLDKDKAVWGETPQPKPEEYLTRRVADMVLDQDGNLSGQITVSYEGRAALRERLAYREDDDAERRKGLEKMFKRITGESAAVELLKIDDWSAATDKFAVTAKVSLPGFAAVTGKRTMLPISVFPGDTNPFTHARRVNPVYFQSPYLDVDDIKIKVPDGLQVESLPNSREVPTQFADLKLSATKDGQMIKVNREVTMNGYYFRKEYYPSLREFLEKVKTIGDEQAVLRVSAK